MFGFKTHLARRLLAYLSGSVFGALLITIVSQYFTLQPMLEQTRERNVDAAMENLVQLVSQSLWVFNEEAAREAARAMLRDQFISGIVVNDHAGLFTFRGGDLADTVHTNPVLQTPVEREDRDALTVVVPLLVNTNDGIDGFDNIGTLQIRSDNALIDARVAELARVTLASSVLIILALQVLFYFLVRNIIARPLETVTENVQRFASDLSPDSNVESPQLLKREDEIGRLFQTFIQQRHDLIERDQSLAAHREELEQTVLERTTELRDTNATLVESLDQLKRAQTELIQSEKMASLGTLVSGIAHEVNTPLGIAITASSHLGEELKQTTSALSGNKLTKSGFEKFLEECHETEVLLSSNLNRAATLIQSFKKVAVDQSSDEERLINLREYVDEIVVSLRPKLKHTQVAVSNDISERITLSIPPGALAQILTNLIMNSIIHGFKDGTEPGHIEILAELTDTSVIIIYKDDGIGMDEETQRRIYDPFFTTKRSEGGSGLGMNIVYNLVTSKLNGQIETKSQPGDGLTIKMSVKLAS